MQRMLYGIVTCALAVGCSGVRDEAEATNSTQQALDVTKTRGLTKMQGIMGAADPLAVQHNESFRQDDTSNHYYVDVKIGSDGISGQSIKAGLGTLTAFKTFYGFNTAWPETVASYYNRGDLGIGREMHCVDQTTSSSGQVACYVKNFAAGDTNTEFTFGLSSNIAFANLDAHRAFATVAMVFRRNATINANKVLFAVYNDQEVLANAAALDRTGIQFANAFIPGGPNPVGHGTPGIDFNNHIPSNCISCHGGQQYDFTNGVPNGNFRNEIGSLFLPFDLDQFDFDSAHPRNENTFRDLNQMVRNVANVAGPTIDLNSSVKNQLDVWYNNPAHASTLSGNFTPAIPSGWNGTPESRELYASVIRGSCRNCHMTNDKTSLHFDSEADFKTPVVLAQTVADLCGYVMPHSVQSVRQFWQSRQPDVLAAYLASPAGGNNPSLANNLRNCGPGDVATLDPPLIQASRTFL